jgi:hypothetical protein
MTLKYPLWQEPLSAALLEFDPTQLLAKVQLAREAIAARFQELSYEENNEEEIRLLYDGLDLIRQLKTDLAQHLDPKDGRERNKGATSDATSD